MFEYRLNLPEDAILGLLRERRMAVLQQFDQLTICKKAGEIFAGFVEPPITFPHIMHTSRKWVYSVSVKFIV